MKKLSKKAIQQDINELQKEIVRIHPNPYKYISEKELTKLLQKNAETVKSVKELGLALMASLPVLNDGHTHLALSDDILGTKNYMFKFEFLNDGYYLTKSSETLSIYLGSKLIGLNDFNITTLETKAEKLIPQENEISTQYYLSSKIVEPSILDYLNLKNSKAITLHLEQNDSKASVLIEPESYNNKMISLKDTIKDLSPTLEEKDTYWCKEIQDIKAFYFQYNSCEEREDLKIEEVVNKIKDSDLKNLIVDLRNNRGGNSDILKPLVTYIQKSGSQYKTFILTGTDTYSSGIINLLELSNTPNAISIGEIPHGNPTHYGEVESFTLLNSGLRIFTSSTIFRFKGYRLGESFRPTHIENTQIEDLLNGKDTQIEYLKKLL